MFAEASFSLINVTIINALVVAVVVLIHNEVLIRLSGVLGRMRQSHHFRLIVAVFGVLLAHTIQVWIFAAV